METAFRQLHSARNLQPGGCKLLPPCWRGGGMEEGAAYPPPPPCTQAGAEAKGPVGADPGDFWDWGSGTVARQSRNLMFVPLQCFELKVIPRSCQGQGRFYRMSTSFPFLACNRATPERKGRSQQEVRGVKSPALAPAGTRVDPPPLVGPGWECSGQPQRGFCTFTCGLLAPAERAGGRPAGRSGGAWEGEAGLRAG